MSTWRIFSDAGENFRWEISDEQLLSSELDYAIAEHAPDARRIPSMADLLLQGYSKLVENGKDELQDPPMFRTGLGKSVRVKQSSIAKAKSIIGEFDNAVEDLGQSCGRENEYNSSHVKFQTGPQNLEIAGIPVLRNGSENAVDVSNSMFQTGSGKAVNVSAAGLLRAKALLGLGENHGDENFKGFQLTSKLSTEAEPLDKQSSSHLDMIEKSVSAGFKNALSVSRSPVGTNVNSFGSKSEDFRPDLIHPVPKSSPIKFHTAGGRSISVSSDALQRARSLLGEPELDSFPNEADAAAPMLSFKDREPSFSFSNRENDLTTPFLHKGTINGNSNSKSFTSPLRSHLLQKQASVRLEKISSGSNLIKKFNSEANDTISRSYNESPCANHLKDKSNTAEVDISENRNVPRANFSRKLSNEPLVDISNRISMDTIDNKQYCGEKRRLGSRSSVSPFKRPRNSKFVTPLNKNHSSTTNGLSTLAPKQSSFKERVSLKYPFEVQRAYVKEYVLQPPSFQRKENLQDPVMKMNPDTAENYRFYDGQVSDHVGVEAFYQMLCQSGASPEYLTYAWVSNHYKWIVWKLASYERCYPAKFSGRLLTISNVLEELKYRYERERNYGHRSAIKKILDGDVPPSSAMVLCIASIGGGPNSKIEAQSIQSEEPHNCRAPKIELTDGWYSINALLDELLEKKLSSGKLFVGQKLKICGAKLCGWAGPVSPLEASQETGLLLHMNGTYRCLWADRMGFCKSTGIPLAFRCIKGAGGAVPSTSVGVTRIYPVLYRERLGDGRYLIRTERMEAKMLQLFNQRRSMVVEGIMSEFQRENKKVDVDHSHDGDEGAKIFKLLETAAEPEVLMAGMSSKQLTSFTAYKAKLETMRQSDMHKSIEKALEAAGLSERDVTPFMRIRVIGLTSKCHPRKSCRREGLITIWNPTEQQQLELVEGQAYVVGGLVPSGSDSSTLYLQTRGSTSKWVPLSSMAMEQFEPFFTPRRPVMLSNLGEVPLSSEFDIAAFVVYVGEAYTQAHQRKQWVFVTDGSMPDLFSEKLLDSLLAISFCFPCIECDPFVPVNYNLIGSTVGFCNLIKRRKDQENSLWLAEATENSTYLLTYDQAGSSYLKDAAASVSKWAKASSATIEKLKDKVLSIISNSEARKF